MSQRRQRQRREQRQHPRQSRRAGSLGLLEGAPVYDAHLVVVAANAGRPGVLLGIGPEAGAPVAWLAMCPTHGVADVVGDLREAAAPIADEHDACCEPLR